MDRRNYIRLESVFPVQYRIASVNGNFISGWQQGFTRNLAKGGMCLEINNLEAELAAFLKTGQSKVFLKIDLPIFSIPVKALACVAWMKNLSDAPENYCLGLNYEQIDPAKNAGIMNYARAKKLFVPVTVSAIVTLCAIFMLNSYMNIKLIERNKLVIQRFVNATLEFNAAKIKIRRINEEKEKLDVKIRNLEDDIKGFDKERSLLKENAQSSGFKTAQMIVDFNSIIDRLNLEKSDLQGELAALKKQETNAAVALSSLQKEKAGLEKANLGNMYHWLIVHQNPQTGLVMSFEGDNEIADWAFIYDQSLTAQVFTIFSDYTRAGKILDFFLKKAKRSPENLFHNAYYVNDASPAEYTVHCGPNIWLGISALQYTYKSGDEKYLGLAEEIASGVISIQNEDKEGGIKGGPGISWYSTEHNLDAYAFFDMLHTITAKAQYKKAKEQALNWLVHNTYNKMNIPIARGKGDSTIATDTYAWSIAAIGPEKLAQLDLNPDQIMQFAENNCAVTVNYKRPEGKILKVKGFDFAPQRHVARGGVVSSEWTAQMIESFKILADYYRKKGMLDKYEFYSAKANSYLSQLGCMIISSPSPSGQGDSCLPYATQENADTGHGWSTPSGKSTGSVAGTAYTLFAYFNYNPLKFNSKFSGKPNFEKELTAKN